jgi:hypothetical protein
MPERVGIELPSAAALGSAISTVASSGAIAYFFGWLSTTAYYGNLDAGWLAYAVPTRQILAWSSVPLVMVAAIAMFIFLGRTLDYSRAFVGVGLLAGASLALWYSLGTTTPGRALVVQTGFSLVYAATAIMLLTLIPSRDRPLPVVVRLVAILACFLGTTYMPVVLGLQMAKLDEDPCLSRLPVVRFEQAGSRVATLRALLATNERVYGVKLRRSGPPRRVVAIAWDRVRAIGPAPSKKCKS